VLEDALLRYLPGRLEQLRLAMEADEVTRDSLPDHLVRDWLTPDGRARVQIYPAEDLADNRALTTFVEAVYTVAPGATDSPIEIYEAGRAVVSAISQAALTALVVVTLMLLILLRSVRGTLLVLLPLALAALMTTSATVILDLPFNFANVIVLPLLMGLGVASGIHLVVRAVQDPDGAALSETSTPRAVILSALTTIGSFGSLAVSDHRGTASMGELLTIAIAFTLICTLIVLPALMAWIGPRRAAGGAE
jgi:predicted RND superfamily exporter protein